MSVTSTPWRLSLALIALTAACGRPVVPTVRIMPAALVPIDRAHNRSTEFGRMFCGTLAHFRDANGHAWDHCERYLERAEAPAAAPPADFTSPFHVLFVGGLGDDCLTDGMRAFGTAIRHLHEVHHLEVERYSRPPFASSQDNGQALARYINERWTADHDHRPYVLVGYSKGAADLAEALAAMPVTSDRVAAIVTIAGIVNGSSEAEVLRPVFDPSAQWTDRHCPIGIDIGLRSFAPDERHEFLSHHPLSVPAYSLVGVVQASETSRMLRGSWAHLSRSAIEHDGLVVAWDAVLPDATYLGMAHADHLAIALPFADPEAHRKSKTAVQPFPRDALFEAVVRFVINDAQARRAKP